MYTTSIRIDSVIAALAGLIQPFVGAAKIVRGQANRVPLPKGACVVLTELGQYDLETPTVVDYATINQMSLLTPKRIDVQIDFYGQSAGDWCTAVKTVYRSHYATSRLPPNIQPLYCSDGMQSPLVTGEQQYERRWILTASLQYNPKVIVPQEYADEAYPKTVNAVDVIY